MLQISINYPLEYLVSISGTFGSFNGSDVVKSLCFKTNVTSYGPYGTNSGTAFSYDGKGGMVLGFHGRAHSYLSAIGVYVIPESLASAPSSTYKGKIMPELCSSMAMPREVGPWGAGGGKPWDDGVFSTIKQVRVHVGELNAIYALQFEYLKKDGKSVFSQIHGGTDGVKNILVVNLDENDEFLTGISGFYGLVKGYNGLETIRSISFHTNKRIHGPYGEERGAGHVYYSSTASPGKIVGFHGRDIGFLSAIGVHMEYF
ncbi:putative jacalin-like lectin domain-containing protein [Helianthus anomalus]